MSFITVAVSRWTLHFPAITVRAMLDYILLSVSGGKKENEGKNERRIWTAGPMLL